MPALTSILIGAGVAAQAAGTIAQVNNANASRDQAKKAMDDQNAKEQQLETDAKNQQDNQTAQNNAAAQRDADIQKQRGLNQQGRSGTILTGGVGGGDSALPTAGASGSSMGAGAGKTILGG